MKKMAKSGWKLSKTLNHVLLVFEGYWLPTRFGFDLRKVDLSSLILTGQKSREEALTELDQPATLSLSIRFLNM